MTFCAWAKSFPGIKALWGILVLFVSKVDTFLGDS